MEKVSNEQVLGKVNEDGKILNSVWQWNHQWDSHVLTCEYIEGRAGDKTTRGRRRIQMLHNVAQDDGYAELRRIADGREEQRHSVRMSKTCSVAVDCRPMMRTGTLTSLLS